MVFNLTNVTFQCALHVPFSKNILWDLQECKRRNIAEGTWDGPFKVARLQTSVPQNLHSVSKIMLDMSNFLEQVPQLSSFTNYNTDDQRNNYLKYKFQRLVLDSSIKSISENTIN